MKKRASFIYVYVGLFLIAVLIILIGNSYFLIDRTRSNLIEIYWKQGELIVKSIAVSAQQAIESIDLTQQQIRRHLKKTLQQIDSYDFNGTTPPMDKLREIQINSDLLAIRILDENGNEVTSISAPGYDAMKTESEKREQSGESEPPLKILRFERENAPGFIEFILGADKLQKIKIQIGLQLLIASLESRNIAQYSSFVDEHFKVLADSDPARIGIIEEELEYADALESGVSYYFRDSNEDSMKIIHPLNFTPDLRGVLKISYPITRIDKIYENTFKNTVVNSSVVMLLAIFAAIVAVKLSKRNLEKIERMEKKIRENEKLVSLANLTAGVAHEVRNPLNSVSITLQRLQLEFAPKNRDDHEEYEALTDLMKREVDRINHIITDFLDFAKPFDPKSTEFIIEDFLEDSLTLFRGEAAEKGVSIVSHISGGDTKFLGDQEKLTQVLLNILRNALEASQNNETITLSSRIVKNSHWELSVSDQGDGIPKENLNHIFDIYFTTKQNGTGLGLYICRKIIHAHKGTIELRPNNGRGITVLILLPFMEF